MEGIGSPYRSLGASDQLPHPGQGRVNLSAETGSRMDPIAGFGHQQSSETNFQADMLRGNWEDNKLSQTFYSAANLAVVQTAIRRGVYEKSHPKGYVIDNQSVDELKIIMRATFLQYARNLPNDITGQVDDLNKRVVAWSVPHILSAVEHYQYYLKDIESMPVPLARSVSVSSAGTRSLPLGNFM